MKTTASSRQWFLIAAFAGIGAIASLPLAVDSLRSDVRAESSARIGKVTLTCFDRDMRANDCAVATNTSLAAK
jgi:hypothetical protein